MKITTSIIDTRKEELIDFSNKYELPICHDGGYRILGESWHMSPRIYISRGLVYSFVVKFLGKQQSNRYFKDIDTLEKYMYYYIFCRGLMTDNMNRTYKIGRI